MATSLLAVVLAAGTAAAQAPTRWAPAGDKPKATWQPYPAPPTSGVPLPSAASPITKPVDVSVNPPQPIGSRVVLYNKPAGDVQPVQAVTPQPVNAVAPRVQAAQATADDKASPVSLPKGPEKARVFRIPTDDDVLEEITKSNAADEKKYREDLATFMANPDRREADKPKPPQPIRPDDFAVSLRGTPAATAPPIKPGYAPLQVKLEPGYVVHRRLFFEEKNSERYGWDLGMAQPVFSAAYFYKDVLLWPGHMMSNFSERFDTSAGKCPPGSPVPYLFYPPELTIRGGLWETAAVVGVAFLIP